MENYKNLLSPIRIGGVEVKNRIVMSPMGDGYSTDDGDVAEEMIAYYSERAKNGVGLIIIGTTSVEHHEGTKPCQHSIYREGHLRGVKRLAEGLHRFDTRVFVQLCHAGRQGNVAAIGHAPYAPSAVAMPGGITPQELTVEQIKKIEQNFIFAAGICKRAGMDGVELHSGNGYLLNEFLTPYVNKRTDEYGGSLENRTRMIRNIITGIRETCGAFPISVRLSVEEGVDGGLVTEDICEIASLLEKWGVNMINVSAGLGESQHLMMADNRYPQGYLVPSAEKLKSSVKIPVAVAGRIRELDFADRIIADGKADMAIFGRPFNADPAFVRKTLEGRADEVRPCMSCGLCHSTSADGGIRCSMNPTIGLEQWYTSPKLNGSGRSVVVIGGGPSGCEAARMLSLRGFKVTLFERRDRLGGQVNVAAVPPHKGDMLKLCDYYTRILSKLGVDVRLNTEADTQAVNALSPYAVILATGSRPFVPLVKGADGDNVTTAQTLLSGGYPEIHNSTVCVVGIGDTGMETAMWLMERGNRVFLADMLDKPFDRLSRLGRKKYNMLKNEGVELLGGHRLLEIGSDKVRFDVDGTVREYNVQYTVMSLGVKPNNELAATLREQFGDKLLCVGDVKDIGQVHEAIFTGFNAAWNLDANNASYI